MLMPLRRPAHYFRDTPALRDGAQLRRRHFDYVDIDALQR